MALSVATMSKIFRTTSVWNFVPEFSFGVILFYSLRTYFVNCYIVPKDGYLYNIIPRQVAMHLDFLFPLAVPTDTLSDMSIIDSFHNSRCVFSFKIGPVKIQIGPSKPPGPISVTFRFIFRQCWWQFVDDYSTLYWSACT